MATPDQKRQFEDYHRNLIENLASERNKEKRNWRKRKARWTDDSFVDVFGDRIKLEAHSPLEKGEFWIAILFHGDRWGIRWPHHLDEALFFPPHPAKDCWGEPLNYFRDLLDRFNEKADERTFRYNSEKKGRVVPSTEAQKLLNEGGKDGRGCGYGVTLWHSDSKMAASHLEQALAHSSNSFGGEIPKSIALALLYAYSAGIHANKAESWGAIERSREGYEWEDGKGGSKRNHKRWQLRCLEIWKDEPSRGNEVILRELEKEGLAWIGGKGWIFAEDNPAGVLNGAGKIKDFKKDSRKRGGT